MSEAIGILGGTFDPIHFGHLRTALDVVEQLDLDHIRLIPSARPPHREQPQANPKQRLAMLQLAIKNNEQFVIDDREIHREGDSYTVDTLLSLREDFVDNPLFLIMGTDAFTEIQSWSRWQKLLELAHIVVMQRPNENLTMPDEYQNQLAEKGDEQLAAGKVWPLVVTQLAISATDIRAKIADDKNPQYLLPDAVIQLVGMLGLYKK